MNGLGLVLSVLGKYLSMTHQNNAVKQCSSLRVFFIDNRFLFWTVFALPIYMYAFHPTRFSNSIKVRASYLNENGQALLP